MNRLFAYDIAEQLPLIDVSGSYDPDQQLWVGHSVTDGCTCSTTQRRIDVTSQTGTGYNCSDGDRDDKTLISDDTDTD